MTDEYEVRESRRDSRAHGTSEPSWDAVVYDLDGTLVRLAVEWGTVDAELRSLLDRVGVDHDSLETWDLYDAAVEAGVGGEAEELVAAHERRGAEQAERLPLADELLADERPAAVCSLNCEAACRTALDREGLLERVAAVVGRDTVPGKKPDPGPLLAAVEALGLPPERVLFVGDSESDEVTAERAGTGFRYV